MDPGLRRDDEQRHWVPAYAGMTKKSKSWRVVSSRHVRIRILAQRVQQVEEIAWRFGVERHRLARGGMRECQVFGVQCLALEPPQGIRQLRRRTTRQLQAATIKRIAHQRPAGV